jgi:hypothetical protein
LAGFEVILYGRFWVIPEAMQFFDYNSGEGRPALFGFCRGSFLSKTTFLRRYFGQGDQFRRLTLTA